jgi:hypothetical protein
MKSRIYKRRLIIKVTVNEMIVEIFNGARIKNAILCYSKDIYKKALEGKIIIIDKNGNQVDLSGELSGGETLRTIDR